jgi:hypothetical protein
VAEPSRAGWHDTPPDKRFCAHCGEKLSLRLPGGLWFDEMHGLVYHHACRILARKAAA